ncbi:MAG: amidohydrolase family protein [Deltaproteobacteria bacterium]|nr:amidohydrolase family protein [Deltaproteobacteria bacterium]
MLDLVIRNARICDGTGRPSYIGSLGVKAGRIAQVGLEDGLASRRTIDAEGMALAPGFVDPHTHYDAQVAWDPLLTCSPWHGVTTVVTGNCGVGVAPVKPETRDVLLHDLVNVEAIPYDVMKAGVQWGWERFDEYLGCLDRRGLGINVAALVALTPLRHYVLGEAAFERPATDTETETMRGILSDAVAKGAFGFSTSNVRRHVGHEGRPLACRNASHQELAGLCHVLRDAGRGAIQIALHSGGGGLISDEDLELLRLLTTESQRPVTWLALFARAGDPDFHRQNIDKLGTLLERAVPQVTPRPLILQDDLRKPFLFVLYPSWKPALNRSAAEQIQYYRQTEFRQAFLEDMKGHVRHHLWGRVRVLDVGKSELEKYRGRTILEIAADENRRPLDVYLDIGIADDLATRYQVEAFNFDPEGVERLMADDRFLVGLGDGGAHVDILCDAGYCTALLEIWVRERKVLSLEKAVQKLTSVPAAFYGIPERGLLAPGKVADLVLFDPAKVASKPPEFVNDFPLNGRRLVARAEGIAATFVAGEQLYENGTHTGVFPGRVLRSFE